MTESEVVRLPTSVLRESVTEKVGVLYSYLFDRMNYLFLVILLIVLVVLFLKVRSMSLARNAKKFSPDSTNEWFSWEEFDRWKGEQKKE